MSKKGLKLNNLDKEFVKEWTRIKRDCNRSNREISKEFAQQIKLSRTKKKKRQELNNFEFRV